MIIRVDMQPAPLAGGEYPGAQNWEWYECVLEGRVYGVVGITLDDPQALWVYWRLIGELAPSEWKDIIRVCFPWMRAYAREQGKHRFVTQSMDAEDGYLKMVEAIGFDHHSVTEDFTFDRTTRERLISHTTHTSWCEV